MHSERTNAGPLAKRDTASLAFGSDPLVGVADEGIAQSSLAVMRSLHSGCFGPVNTLMLTVPRYARLDALAINYPVTSDTCKQIQGNQIKQLAFTRTLPGAVQ
ncbi:unnamed protein product [Merluccius merluccius]